MLSRGSMVPTAITAAVVIASVAVWWLHSRGAANPASQTELDRIVPAKAPLPVPEHNTKTDPVTNRVVQDRAEMSVDVNSDGKRSGTASGMKRTGMAGGQFVMSNSILVACNDPGIKGAHTCDRLYADLAQITKEPRDVTWASDMEEKLQAYVEQTFKDASIRNIDCRTSLCAMEVQTEDPTIAAVFHPYPQPLLNQLDRDTWMESAVGTTPRVFVVMYKRL
jgi:hypothetical protein